MLIAVASDIHTEFGQITQTRFPPVPQPWKEVINSLASADVLVMAGDLVPVNGLPEVFSEADNS